MSQRQILSALSRLWCGMLLVTSVGCQTYSPYGYGGYPGAYNNYPAYNQGAPMSPYGAAGIQQGQVNPSPDPGYSGGLVPNTFGPGYGRVTPTPYPNVPNGQIGGYQQGVDTSGNNLGPAGQFPEAGATRPRIPGDRPSLPPDDPDYTATPGVPTPPRAKVPAPAQEFDEADIKSDISTPAEKATQKLKSMENKPISTGQFQAQPADYGPQVADAGQSNIIQTSQHVTSRELKPYGRADDGRAWFRGLVDYDAQENVWYLTYNPDPDSSDRRGGTISLIEHPNLKLFNPEDIVLVEGDFDPSAKDGNGNSKYRATVIRRLVP